MASTSLNTLLLMSLALLACKAGPDSDFSESSSASEYKIRIESKGTNAFAILVAAPGVEQTLGMCVAPAAEQCSQAHPLHRKLNFLRKQDDRTIYQFSEEVTLPTENIFTIVDSNNVVKRRFKISSADQNNNPDSTPGDLNSALQLVNQAVLQKDLTYLTRDEWRGRLSGTPENDAAANWLVEQARAIGLQPGNNGNYKQAFRIAKLGGVTANNIIGIIPGNDPQLKNEYVLIGAHMDHAGTLSKGYTCSPGAAGSNDICNGADDNGSGTVTLLNIARGIVNVQSQLKRSVIIMWFAGEEEGLIGSNHFVNNPTVELRQIKLMINMDMVGYLRQNNNQLLAIGTTADKTEYKIAQTITTKYSGVSLRSSATAQGGSDHAPFMGKGIPAIFFHTGVSSNPNYHKTSDTPDKIDYVGMEKIGRIALETLYTVANEVSPQGFGLVSTFGTSLLPPEELEKSCHHLIEVEKSFYDQIDFTDGNDGVRRN